MGEYYNHAELGEKQVNWAAWCHLSREYLYTILLAKVGVFEMIIATGENKNNFSKEVGILEAHDQMGKIRNIIEVPLAVRRCA